MKGIVIGNMVGQPCERRGGGVTGRTRASSDGLYLSLGGSNR